MITVFVIKDLKLHTAITSGFPIKDHHLEARQLTCRANRSTGLYIMWTLNINGLIDRILKKNMDLSFIEYLQTTLHKFEYV